MTWALGIVLTFLVAAVVFAVYRDLRFSATIEQQNRAITNLYAQIETISAERMQYYNRIIDLENGIETEFGVKVRQEVTVVKTHFTKLEWVVMLSGVDKLLRSAKTPDDARVLLQILDKIREFMDHLKEEPEEGNAV